MSVQLCGNLQFNSSQSSSRSSQRHACQRLVGTSFAQHSDTAPESNTLRTERRIPNAVSGVSIVVPGATIIHRCPIREKREGDEPEQHTEYLETQDCPAVVIDWLAGQCHEVVGEDNECG